MAIDTAEKRRSVSGLQQTQIAGVTSNATKDQEWRQEVGWSYPAILAAGAAPLGPLIAGTVPVRYLIGQIPNIVPVETVLTSEAGVVPVREFVGPANVVPVRETATEVPRVKVRKV